MFTTTQLLDKLSSNLVDYAVPDLSMNKSQPKAKQTNTLVPLLVNFIIPIVILTRFSGPAQLGPTIGLLLALALPIAYEIYSIYSHRRVSYISLLAIGGILITGVISLLGLGENWLAIRRAAPYLAGAVVALVSIVIKHPVVQTGLAYLIDMPHVVEQARKNRTTERLEQIFNRAGYLLSFVLLVTAVVSYVLSKVVIVSAANTSSFNQEYANLRLLSLPAITLPMFVAIISVLFYVVRSIKEITGLEFDAILKKR